jgi:hypothetical protein
MGFGAVITCGTDNHPLPADIAECLLEVRVEQAIGEATHFGVRVRDDLSEGSPMASKATELAGGAMLGICVENGDGMVCLVRGPITDTKLKSTVGGPGSTFEVHGSDRCIELDRKSVTGTWSGKASDAAQVIIGSLGATPDVQTTQRSYDSRSGTLNQSGTALEFVRQIARENGMHFWLSYKVKRDPLDLTGANLKIEEVGNFKSSPPRSDSALGALASALPVMLAPADGVVLRPQVGDDCGHNVSSFEVNADQERPTKATFAAIDLSSIKVQSNEARSKVAPMASGGSTLDKQQSDEHSMRPRAAGDPEDVQRRAEAALAEQAFNITAHGSTTFYMLRGLLLPHDIVSVERLGPEASVPFRVRKVTHVITPSDHYMDFELQTNARGSGR